MLERTFLFFHDRIAGRPRAALLLVVLAVGAALPALATTHLDMSFRPLFADDAAAVAPTREFAAVFGQPSGAFIGVVIEPAHGKALDAEFVRSVAVTSGAVEKLDHVTEVVSLARVRVPGWQGTLPRGSWLHEPALLEHGPAAGIAAALAYADADPHARAALARLLSSDRKRTVLFARLDVPLQDLAARTAVIEKFRTTVEKRFGRTATLHFVGISVVEAAYARIVLRSLLLSMSVTLLAVALLLWRLFASPGGVVIPLAGVALATPLTLAFMTLRGQSVTIVNSLVPTMILIIGVADAIHMQHAYVLARKTDSRGHAIRKMYEEMALPCLLTALTTVLGFVSLRAASVTALSDFGTNVALGVTLVYLINLVTAPALLHALPERWLPRAGAHEHAGGAWADSATRVATHYPVAVVSVFAACMAAGVLLLPRLIVDQRFNEDVSERTPVRAAQALLERDFGGFLGPELFIERRDAAPLDSRAFESIARLAARVAVLPDVQRVEGLSDLLAGRTPRDMVRTSAALRGDPLLGRTARELVDARATRTAVLIRTGDIGSTRALELGRSVEDLAARELGPQFRARVVGEWWLAQKGLAGLLRDMLRSFATSIVLIVPLLALAAGSRRLLLVAIVPNIFPMFFALAFMAVTGIGVRVGTAMILAIALGIAVDDTIHLLVRLRREGRSGAAPEAALRHTLESTGTGVLYTTVVLVVGFLAMSLSPMLALREMGIVAAATLAAAFAADAYLVPALFILAARLHALRQRKALSTSPGGSAPVLRRGIFSS
jgi:predicted RND superfamily exporter protein